MKKASFIVDENSTELTDQKKVKLPPRTSKHTLFFESISALTHTNSMSSPPEHLQMTKMDVARASAPFVMGTTVQQFVKVVCITQKGEQSSKTITKHEFSKQVGVHIRDLRILEKSPANRVEAAVNPRSNTILLSIEGMKMAIFHDEVVIFCPEEDIVSKFIDALQQNIQVWLRNVHTECGEMNLMYSHVTD